MTLHTSDKSVLEHIEHLVAEEKRLYAQGTMSDAERERLGKLNVELDRCWDLLRQRRAARVRPQSRRGRRAPGLDRGELSRIVGPRASRAPGHQAQRLKTAKSPLSCAGGGLSVIDGLRARSHGLSGRAIKPRCASSWSTLTPSTGLGLFRPHRTLRLDRLLW